MQGSDATVSLKLLEKVFPAAASGAVTRFHTLIICRQLCEICFAVFAVLRLSLFCFV